MIIKFNIINIDLIINNNVYISYQTLNYKLFPSNQILFRL